MTRKLATIRKIEEIKPIEGADAIEAARVDGWWVVIKKGEFAVGDTVIYLEIDSWVPQELAPFLVKGAIPREYNGVKGERLRTVKLRGQISQGLILPLYNYEPTAAAMQAYHSTRPYDPDESHFDVSEVLGIQKWEPEVAANMRGMIRGSFPSWLRKTDQERIQNCYKEVSKKFESYWVGEEKLDGSSMTVGIRFDEGAEPEVHVCSRNLSIKLDDIGNSFVKAAMKSNVIEAMIAYGKNIAVSGELIGPGIQGNKYKLNDHQWHIFDVYDVDSGRYLTPFEREGVLVDLQRRGFEVRKTPIIQGGSIKGMSVDDLLKHAEGESALNPKTQREGIVWKCLDDGDLSFKAISNAWLIKNKE